MHFTDSKTNLMKDELKFLKWTFRDQQRWHYFTELSASKRLWLDESSVGNKKLAMIMKVCTIFNANNSRVWECIISVASANGMSPARDSSRRGIGWAGNFGENSSCVKDHDELMVNHF